MFDAIFNFISKPDSWAIIFGVIWAIAVGGSRFLAKKFGWRPRFYLKPVQPPIAPTLVNNLIDQELRDWKSKYSTLEALLEVSRSQWTEKIEELTIENARLKTETETERGTQETKPKEEEGRWPKP